MAIKIIADIIIPDLNAFYKIGFYTRNFTPGLDSAP
jgi:hypothetical protein